MGGREERLFHAVVFPYAKEFNIDLSETLGIHVEEILCSGSKTATEASFTLPLLSSSMLDLCRMTVHRIDPEDAMVAMLLAVVRISGNSHMRLKQVFEFILEHLNGWKEEGIAVELDIKRKKHSQYSMQQRNLLNRSLNSSKRSDNNISTNTNDSLNFNSDDEQETKKEREEEEEEYVILPIADIHTRVIQTIHVLQCISSLSQLTTNNTTINSTNTTTSNSNNNNDSNDSNDSKLLECKKDVLDFHQLNNTKKGWIAQVLHYNISSSVTEQDDPSMSEGAFWTEIRRHVCTTPFSYTISATAAIHKNAQLFKVRQDRRQKEKELRKQRKQYNRYDVNDSSIMHRSTVNEVRGLVEDTRPVLLLRRLCDLMKANSDW